jgi:hypothetical protein
MASLRQASLGCARDRQGRCGPDPAGSWDVPHSKVASSELTERDLCCTIWASSGAQKRKQIHPGEEYLVET